MYTTRHFQLGYFLWSATQNISSIYHEIWPYLSGDLEEESFISKRHSHSGPTDTTDGRQPDAPTKKESHE